VDPGFAAFRIPASGSGIFDECNPDSDLVSGIFGTLDPGWINFDPESAIYVQDPQHCLTLLYLPPFGLQYVRYNLVTDEY
jgi:hypothetical protein